MMSIVKINLFSTEKVKSRKIFSAWMVSLMWNGKDFTNLRAPEFCLNSWR